MRDVEGAVANCDVVGSNGSGNDEGIKWGERQWPVRFELPPHLNHAQHVSAMNGVGGGKCMLRRIAADSGCEGSCLGTRTACAKQTFIAQPSPSLPRS